MQWEGFLEVDPSFEVGRYEKVFMLSFSGKMISIEVTTRHEDELTGK